MCIFIIVFYLFLVWLHSIVHSGLIAFDLSSIFIDTDPLLGDCPDYSDLAPSPSLKKRRLKIEQGLGKKKTSKKDEADDVVNDDAATDEVRMCSTCERLVGRRLRQLEGQETTILEAIYKKMQLVMEEASRHQPLYQEMVDSLL